MHRDTHAAQNFPETGNLFYRFAQEIPINCHRRRYKHSVKIGPMWGNWHLLHHHSSVLTNALMPCFALTHPVSLPDSIIIEGHNAKKENGYCFVSKI